MSADPQSPDDETAPASPSLYYIQGSTGDKIEISALAIKQSKTMSDASSITEGVIPFTNISESILRKIVEWCEHHKGEDTPKEDGNIPADFKISDWDEKYFQISNGELFNLIVAVNFLDIPKLLDYSCKKVADLAKDKSPEEMRTLFGILTDEEDQAAEEAKKSSK